MPKIKRPFYGSICKLMLGSQDREGKEKFILLISADVKEDALGYDIEDHFEKIKTQIREKYPNAEYIYIEAKDAVRNQKE